MAVAWAGSRLLQSDSVAGLFDFTRGPGLLSIPLQYGLFAWLAYVGFEPQIRRVWPHLLVTSTRLLSGRWRDPLVGRAVLAGIVVGSIFVPFWSQTIYAWLDLPGGGPTGYFP